ncbi:MAG TPA: hypothetical protein VFL57_03650, partial [Bryobacteraceae bacterium]|nr:hypothetical protein [Bryobacteraceae bacterium]
ADILIRIAESPTVSHAGWKLELLETAFQIATAARHPLKRVTAVRVADPEAVWRVFDRKLDTLSLQVRIVRAILPLDAGRAVETFDRITLPRIPPLPCGEALGYSVHDYYAAAAELFARDPERILALTRALASVWQLEPVARMLTRVSLPEDDFRRAALAYADALRRITADDRSFASATANAAAPTDELGRRSRMSAVADGWHIFQSRHGSEPRCTDPAIPSRPAAPIQHRVLEDADALLGPVQLR